MRSIILKKIRVGSFVAGGVLRWSLGDFAVVNSLEMSVLGCIRHMGNVNRGRLILEAKALVSAGGAALLLGVQGFSPAYANEAQTFADSFSVPVFDRIDQNGVDLVTGTWRVRTPTIWVGEGQYRQERGLQWTGQAWTHIGQPSLWRDGSKYIVMYKGQSHEFNGFSSGFSKRAPIDGSSLSCDTLVGGDGISYCRFTSRDGDYVVFSGFYSGLSQYGQYMGLSSLEFGNVGIMGVLSSEVAFGSPAIVRRPDNTYYASSYWVKSWGAQITTYGWPWSDPDYYKVNYNLRLDDQKIIINTPNSGDDDEHYLRPDNVVQTVTDDFGNSWTYQINNDRELIRVTQPGGGSAVTATYYDNHKVKTITTAAGTWNYSYTTPGSYGTTTVISPSNEVTYVKYHRDHGYVTEARDPLSRTTYYTWNSTTRRLERVTFPEGNYVSFQYDARGNVTQKTEVSKNGTSSLTWQASYASSCGAANQANCNQPRYVIDPKGNRTDYEYTGNSPGPTKVIQPAATAGAPRATTLREYSSGRLVREVTCTSQASCPGSADEVVSEYAYGNAAYGDANSRNPIGYTVFVREEKTTSDGEVILVCHQYDNKGHKVGTTPPNANLTSCPAAQVNAVSVTSNSPTAGYARSAPTFSD